MKRILALLLVLTLLCFTACSGDEADTSAGDNTTTTISTCKHDWSSWSSKTEALVGLDGTEERTCSKCNTTETVTTTENALKNSFGKVDISGLMRFWMTNDGSEVYDIPYGVEAIQGVTLLSFLGYNYDGTERKGADFEISSAAAYDYLSTYFVLNDTLKADMKEDPRYDSVADVFRLTTPGDPIYNEILGYEPNGENRYTVYYVTGYVDGSFESCWKVDTEYNILDGKPNRFLSVMRLSSIPDNIIQ